MDKVKLLTFSVVALLVLNFGVLGFLVFSKSKNHRPEKHETPREIIIDKLNFDENQVDKYDKLIQKNRKNIDEIDDSISNTKNKLYQLLNSQTINKVEKDSLISKINFFQKQIEATNFNHFIDIKNLCNKDQIDKFEDLTKELSKIFSRKPKRRND